MLALNAAGTHYTNKEICRMTNCRVPEMLRANGPASPMRTTPTNTASSTSARTTTNPDVKAGRYLVDEAGNPAYRTDVPINRQRRRWTTARRRPNVRGSATQLFALIIEGILGGKLEWRLVVIGVLIAVAMELAGVSALPFAVGMYLPLSASSPIFVGGMLRWLVGSLRGKSASEAEAETSPGVLLSSGYIAGGTLCGLIVAFFVFLPDRFNRALDLGRDWGGMRRENAGEAGGPGPVLILAAILLWVGGARHLRKMGDEYRPIRLAATAGDAHSLPCGSRLTGNLFFTRRGFLP